MNPVRDHQMEQLVTEAQQLRNADRPMFTRAISEQFRQRFRNGRTVREVFIERLKIIQSPNFR